MAKQTVAEHLVSAEDVRKRIPLLTRVVEDAVACFDARRKAKERLEELVVISRQFTSCEIQETIHNLRRRVHEYDGDMEAFEKEIRLLGGILRDTRRGLVYFYSEREGRRVFLVWDLSHPDAISWHELDENFGDRTLLEPSEDPAASALDVPE